MPIETINIGNIANDGTGDDLREAFRKVNNNFDDLNTRFPEDAVGNNLSELGENVFASSANSVLNFKTLIAGANISLTGTDSTITFDVPTSIRQLIAITDSGSITVVEGQTIGFNGNAGLSTRAIGQNVVIEATDGILSQDGTPTLAANLDVDNNDIINANNVTANTFNGSLEGLVYGIDVRDISAFPTGFDFKSIRQEYTNLFDYIVSQTDVDFGTIVGVGVEDAIVDLGTFV
jgi:hypothetical protein